MDPTPDETHIKSNEDLPYIQWVETLRIGPTQCIELNIFHLTKHHEWVFSTESNKNEDKDSKEKYCKDLILQKVLALLSPRLGKDLNSEKEGDNRAPTKKDPEIIITDTMVMLYFIQSIPIDHHLPKFHLTTQASDVNTFQSLSYHPSKVVVAIHPFNQTTPSKTIANTLLSMFR